MPDTPVSLLERLSLHPDGGAWTRFVDLYTPLIRAWLCRHSAAEHDAEDLAQEVMAIVVRELPGFQHSRQRGAFRSWLRTITVNQLRALWRSRHGKAQGTGDSAMMRMLDQLEDPHSSLSLIWDQQHDQHVARRLMELIRSQFESKTWQAFQRVALDGQKAAAVAAELDMSVNAVLLAKSRVLSRLRQEMGGLTD